MIRTESRAPMSDAPTGETPSQAGIGTALRQLVKEPLYWPLAAVPVEALANEGLDPTFWLVELWKGDCASIPWRSCAATSKTPAR